ncbi:TlpA disulfide reductase family protein [Marinoscillum sp. MHG1-6]|uniref:TlpA family protein disulfide reductase n=1 Tax=Marinoscillum sp. MHG1-6 TaxID=2959627 RepID=UPI0021572D17|nr:TlpA disulfide reductase family protein [Marinoscillum sp. MHG1-6]
MSNKTVGNLLIFKMIITALNMKVFLTLAFAFLFALITAQAQIKLDPSYTYYKNGKEVSYKKGLKLLRTGQYIADIQDDNEEVHIKRPPSLEAGEYFPFQEMVDLEGNTISPDMLEGKVVVLNFWFTSCRPCVMEMPELNEVVENYSDKEVIFLAFANDIGPVVTKFIERRPFDYTLIPGHMTKTINLGITIFPTHIVLNRDGMITEKLLGYQEGIGQKLSQIIDNNL